MSSLISLFICLVLIVALIALIQQNGRETFNVIKTTAVNIYNRIKTFINDRLGR